MSLRRACSAAAAATTAALLAGCPTAPTGSQDVSFLEQFSPPPDTSPIVDTNPGARNANLLTQLFSSIATNEYTGDLAVSTSDGTAISIIAPAPSERRLPTGETLGEFFTTWTTAPSDQPSSPPPPPPAPPPSVLGPGAVYLGFVSGNSRETLIGVGEANIPDSRQIALAFDDDSSLLTDLTIPGNILIPDVNATFDGPGDTVVITGVAPNHPLSYSITATLTDFDTSGNEFSAVVSITLTSTFGAATQTATGIHALQGTRGSSSTSYNSVTTYTGTLSASAPGLPTVTFDFIQELTLSGTLDEQ